MNLESRVPLCGTTPISPGNKLLKKSLLIKQQTLLNSIKEYLVQFEREIEISNSNNEFDINVHTENVLIPTLNIIFNYNLINLNKKIRIRM